MERFVAAILIVLSLNACSSSGDRIDEGAETHIGFGSNVMENSLSYYQPQDRFEAGSEHYAGPRTAAVAPVSNERIGRAFFHGGSGVDLQQSIQRQLEDSGIFAGVLSLGSINEGNEAEIIVEPILPRTTGYGNDSGLRIRVIEKTGNKIVLDRVYGGTEPSSWIAGAIAELEKDLAVRYGR